MNNNLICYAIMKINKFKYIEKKELSETMVINSIEVEENKNKESDLLASNQEQKREQQNGKKERMRI